MRYCDEHVTCELRVRNGTLMENGKVEFILCCQGMEGEIVLGLSQTRLIQWDY